MNNLIVYPIHLALLGGGLLALRAMGRRNLPAWALGALALLLCAGGGWWLWGVSEPRHELFADFYKAYHPAGEAMLRGDQERLAWLIGTRDFVNLPVVAWLFAPLAALGAPASGWTFAGIGLAAALAAWAMLVRAARLDRWRAAALLLLFGLSGPLFYSFREGNATHVLLPGIVGAMLLARRRRDWLAGGLLGACAVVKLPLLLFGVYYALRKRWRIAAGGAAAVAMAGALSLALHGAEMNKLWHRECVAPFQKKPMAAYNVQSIAGFLARWDRTPLFKPEQMERWDPWRYMLEDWDPAGLRTFPRYLGRILVLMVAAAAVWAVAFPRRPREDAPALKPALGSVGERPSAMDIEFGMVLLLTLLLGPMAWSHYYVFALVPFALLLGLDRAGRIGPRAMALAWAAMLLCSLPVVKPRIADKFVLALFATTALSHFLAGGLLLFGVVAGVRRKMPRTGPFGEPLEEPEVPSPEAAP